MAANPTGQNYLAGMQQIFTATGGPGNMGHGPANSPHPPGTGLHPPTTPHAPGPTTPSPAPIVSMNPGQNVAPTPFGPHASNPFGMTGATDYSGQSADFGNELGKIFGKGEGSILYDFIQSGGGYNGPLTQQTVDATINSMQHEIMRGWGNMSSNLGMAGVSPNSSVYGLAMGDYFSNAVAQENAITAQDFFNMWSQSMGNETSMIESTMAPAQQHKANSGVMGTISSILGMGSDIGGAIGSGLGAAGVGAGGGAAGGIVDFLAAFCWVAESFWGWESPKTTAVRIWMWDKAPCWFFHFYLKYGKRIAATPLRWLFRPLFEWVIRYGR